MTSARVAAAALLAWAMVAPWAPAQAQSFPTRNITVIVPYAAGGPTDLVARQLAPLITAKLGQNIIVENISGGGTNIATARVAHAAPDGYTLLLHNLQISANVTLYPKLAGETEKHLVPVAFINTNPLVLTGRKSLAANTLPELIAWMKATQSKIAYPGVGSTGHLATALFLQMIGASADLVPYRGAAPAMQDVVAGHIDLFIATPQQAVPMIQAGAIKGYAVTAKAPLKQLPDLPSLVQTLGPKLEVQFWQALFAPAQTPAPVLDRLNAVLREVLRDPALVKTWEETGVLGYADEYHTLAGAKALFRAEIERWGEVIRANKIEGQN
jgi:tripartite-type tricarboxylate transporter receptor subunit TctC